MSLGQALLLALVQGLTEFLPISSSAHLVLLPWVVGWEDQGLVFDAAANSGTLLAVLLYFRSELLGFARSILASRRAEGESDGGGEERAEARLFWQLVAASVPVAVAGLLLQDWVAEQARNPVLVAWTSILFGFLLGFADRFGKKQGHVHHLGWRSALLIGVGQAAALVPGVSRAGITMTGGLVAGLTREAAARFSFLLYIPVSLMVAVKDTMDLMEGRVARVDLLPLLVVFAGSALVGYAVIELLLAWLRRQSLQVFVFYRVLLGLVILILV